MKKIIVMAVFVAGIGGIATASLALPDKPATVRGTEQRQQDQTQLQAPPSPPRLKPIERVVVAPK
jgi:hypothetical protein